LQIARYVPRREGVAMPDPHQGEALVAEISRAAMRATGLSE
jgi:hypothetical protein